MVHNSTTLFFLQNFTQLYKHSTKPYKTLHNSTQPSQQYTNTSHIAQTYTTLFYTKTFTTLYTSLQNSTQNHIFTTLYNTCSTHTTLYTISGNFSIFQTVHTLNTFVHKMCSFSNKQQQVPTSQQTQM